MSALRLLRPDVTPPPTPFHATHPGTPAASTRAAFTWGDAAASAQAMATVPSRTPSTGIGGSP